MLCGQARVARHLAAAAAPALDHDGDEVRLLHRPYTLDQLRDRDAVGAVDPEQDQGFGNVIRQLRLVVKIELFERFENVIEPPQSLRRF